LKWRTRGGLAKLVSALRPGLPSTTSHRWHGFADSTGIEMIDQNRDNSLMLLIIKYKYG